MAAPLSCKQKKMETQDSTESAAAKPLLQETYLAGQYADDNLLELNPGSSSQRKCSNWKAPAILLGFEYLQYVAFNGVSANLVIYLRTVLRGNNASSAANVNTWMGTCYFTPLFGALVADTYWGRYKTILVSGLIFLIGLVVITFSAFILSIKLPLCKGSSCQPSTEAQKLVLFSGLYLVAFGSGGIKSSLVPFGADQFHEENPEQTNNKASFVLYAYFCIVLAILTSGTLIVWVQEYVDWSLGFGIATLCIAVGLGAFVLGTPTYLFQMPTESPLKRILQVLVASLMKTSLKVPSDSTRLYEVNNNNSNIVGGCRLAHTNGFRFLDKAAIISDSDIKNGTPQASWRLCTVTQVEELKLLLRLLPICGTGIIFCAAFYQTYTVFIQQGSTMNTRIGPFSILPASLTTFKMIIIMVWSLVYKKIIVPITRRYFGCKNGFSQLQQIGLGHFLVITAMATAAFLEAWRLKKIRANEHMSIAWQLPQYFIIAGSEFFFYPAMSLLFYEQAPDTMRSLCTAFFMLTMSLGNYLSSFLITLVGFLTKAGGQPGWIPDDLNKGHLDYFFWSLAGLCILNFAVYLAATKNYVPKKFILEH